MILKFESVDEVVLVPKDRSREPRACFSKGKKGKTFDFEASNFWCGVCNYTAKPNSKLIQ